MPIRMLRDWTDSEAVNCVSCQAEVLFIRLIMKADDYGRFSANPKLLRSLLFPLKDGFRESDISSWLKEIETAGLIATYQAEGKPLLEIVKFDQRLRARKSKWPEPVGTLRTDDGTLRTDDGTLRTDDGTLRTDDGLNRIEGNTNMNTKGREDATAPATRFLKTFNPEINPPTVAGVIAQAELQCLVYSEAEAQRFLDNYTGKDWVLPSGRITDWTRYLRSWLEKGKRFKGADQTPDMTDKQKRLLMAFCAKVRPLKEQDGLQLWLEFFERSNEQVLMKVIDHIAEWQIKLSESGRIPAKLMISELESDYKKELKNK